MDQIRVMLEQRRGPASIEDWAFEINQVVQPDKDERLRVATLYSYLNGSRNITGSKGARLLAQYFYRRGDFAMVNALSQITLGIPYPAPNGGADT